MSKDRRFRILLCDDDPDEEGFLAHAFENAGFSVDLECFNRCSTFLDHLRDRVEIPDLIFLDINMPGENGLECLSSVRSFAPYRDVSIFIYSTSALAKDIEKAFENGASLYLQKADSVAELMDTVKYIMSKDLKEWQNPAREVFYFCPKQNLQP